MAAPKNPFEFSYFSSLKRVAHSRLGTLLWMLLLSTSCGGKATSTTQSLSSTPLELLSGNHETTGALRESRNQNAEIVFSSTVRADGTLNVRVQGSGILAVSYDGTVPDRNAPTESTIIAEGAVEIIVTKPTILRAKSYQGQTESPLRSQMFLPDIIDLSIRQLPRGYDIKDVYVTGPFRGWSNAFDPLFKLTKASDGSYKIRLSGGSSKREERFIYKYIFKLKDGSTAWWADPSAPQTGTGEFVNNYLVSSLEYLSAQLLRNTPGFVEEAALDLRLQPVAALDRGEGVVRVQIGFLEGDVEQVKMRFLNGQVSTLEKSSYRRESLPYDRFSGFVRLPDATTQSGFFLELQDGGTSLLLGSKGLLSPEQSLSSEAAFPFSYDAKDNLLNGQDIYQVPLWSIDAVWYQIFPERFRNGDTSNDRGYIPNGWESVIANPGPLPKPTVRDWTSDWFQFDEFEKQLQDSTLGRLPGATTRDIQRTIVINRRYGGDLKGVRDQIPYLKELGINAVYFNPVFESDSNHKYDTKDYRHVDRHFGPMTDLNSDGVPDLYPDDERILAKEDLLDPSTWGYTRADKEFMKLVSELHANGIKVVIDGVYNHSAATSIFMRDIAKRGKESVFYNWFEMAYLGDPGYGNMKCNLSEFYPDRSLYPEAHKVAYDAWFGFCTLPNHREGYPETVLHPQLAEHIYHVLDRWLTPKVVDGIEFGGVDGVRLDVYGDINHDYWKLFRKQVKSLKKDALIVAEEWYEGFDILRGDQTDILMNYTARTLAEGWFINTNQRERFRPSMASDYVDFRLNNLREHVKYALWTMLDSHDTDRMYSKTLFRNRALSPRPQDGNSWDDGSVNRPDLGAPYSNDKPGPEETAFFKSIVGMQIAYMGAPLIYYGAEQGMWGSDDPTCRKPMMWPDLFDASQSESQCITASGLWCELKPDTKFLMEPNQDLYETYKRLISLRKYSRALRRGSLTPHLNVIVDGLSARTGNRDADYLFLWGFERAFANEEFVYFLSNQNLARESQTITLSTNWQPGEQAIDMLTLNTYEVDRDGRVTFKLDRDRAVLLVDKTTFNAL